MFGTAVSKVKEHLAIDIGAGSLQAIEQHLNYGMPSDSDRKRDGA